MANRDYRLMAIFVAIANAGSIRGAARRLGISAPVVSTALADLEANLGVTLVRRGPRLLSLTEQGRAFHDAAAEMVAAGERAMALIADARLRPRGRLKLTLSTELCVRWLPPRLRAFEAAHPLVDVGIDATDAVVNLGPSEFDMALRATFRLRPRWRPDVLDVLPVALVASPAFAARHGRAVTRAGAALPFIGFSVHERGGILPALRPNGDEAPVTIATRISVNNGLVAMALARAGFGAALVLREVAAEELARGDLVELAPALSFGAIVVRLLLRDEHPSPAARAFVAFLRARAAGR